MCASNKKKVRDDEIYKENVCVHVVCVCVCACGVCVHVVCVCSCGVCVHVVCVFMSTCVF